MNKKLFYFLQILIGLKIIIIIYFITITGLNIQELIVRDDYPPSPKEIIPIIRGFAPVSYLQSTKYNTFNSLAKPYKRIPRSVNTKGGAQFTYQFWIKIENTDTENYKNTVILHKGDITNYKVGIYDNTTNKLVSSQDNVPIIACPRISFKDSFKNLQVLINTTKNPLTTLDIIMTPEEDVISRQNLLSLMPLSWTLLTFTFQDSYSLSSSAENGISFKFYVNDLMYRANNPSDNPILRDNALIQNDGDLFLFPNKLSSNYMHFGNLVYYNWALSIDEIRKTFQQGPPTKSAIETKNNDSQTIMSAVNKIDIYNY